MGGIAAHLRESGRSFAAVFRSANLRRLQGAWTAVAIGHWGLLVAVSVYAYDQGGEKAVGIIFLLRLVPAGLLAPFVGVLGDPTGARSCCSLLRCSASVSVRRPQCASGRTLLQSSSTRSRS